MIRFIIATLLISVALIGLGFYTQQWFFMACGGICILLCVTTFLMARKGYDFNNDIYEEMR